MFAIRKKRIRSRNTFRSPSDFRGHIIKGVVSITLTVLVVVAVHYVTRFAFFTINTITVTGGETISHEEVRGKVDMLLTGNYLGLIPKRFSYLFPESTLYVELESIPHMKSVHIERVSRNEISISFDEYVPHALWCVHGEESTPCYFLSDDGVAFAEAPPLSGGAFMRYFTESTPQIQKGSVIDAGRLADIEWLTTKVQQELEFRVASVVLKNNNDIELNLHGGGMFLIASGKDVASTFENLALVLSSDAYIHLAPGNFKYVDVRFDKKVFVNEQMTPVVTLEQATSTDTVEASTASTTLEAELSE